MQCEAGYRVPIGWLKGGQRVQREPERVQAVAIVIHCARACQNGREPRAVHLRAVLESKMLHAYGQPPPAKEPYESTRAYVIKSISYPPHIRPRIECYQPTARAAGEIARVRFLRPKPLAAVHCCRHISNKRFARAPSPPPLHPPRKNIQCGTLYPPHDKHIIA